MRIMHGYLLDGERQEGSVEFKQEVLLGTLDTSDAPGIERL